jgi:hypothetical protein
MWRSCSALAGPPSAAQHRGVGRRIVTAALGVLLLAGCVSPHVFQVPRATGTPQCLVAVPAGDELVGVAMSGGGSRAALFGAGGLEALARLRTANGSSVLERVSYLSSVSGGSLAAASYALTKPPRAVPVLSPDGALSPAYQDFFRRYTGALSQDFESDLIRRQLLSFRWLNPALAAGSLAEVLGQRLLGKATLGDLARREQSGDSPGVIINATLYNNGRRLAGTTLPPGSMQYDFARELQESLQREGRSGTIPATLKERADLLMPMMPMELGTDPCVAPIVGWVTASASFPPLVGPISLRVGDDKTYWHAGDGGLYENQGAESLLFLFLKQMQERRIRRALLLAFDSSFPFAVGDRRLSRRAQPFSLLTFDFSRVPSIMEERASTYQRLFFQSLRLEGVIPDDDILRLVVLRHVDVEWAGDLSDLPAACRAEQPALTTPAAVRERIAEIPTRLRVKSECDRQLLTASAAKVVEQNRARILEFFDAGPTASGNRD